MISIELSENEAKLLTKLLKDLKGIRSDMTCNDPYKKEKKLFTKEERKNMQKIIGVSEEDIEDLDGFMYNCDYPDYLLKIIKNQIIVSKTIDRCICQIIKNKI